MRGRHRAASAARRRLVRGVCAIAATLMAAGTLTVGATPVHAAQPESSAVTVSGAGDFADLKVTVSATKNLISQVVKVSWSGGAPTEPPSGQYDRNYLQIMQCWGDDPAGPDREQCQFGGLIGDSRGGSWVTSRQVTYNKTFVDPAEQIKSDPATGKNLNVPFRAADGRLVATSLNEFYNAYTTNEIPFGRTRPDGTGQEYFEIQSAREAPGLGCGEALKGEDGSTHARNCWLVVVPRSNKEIDGSTSTDSDGLRSSPLSASNWKNHLSIPLTFQPITSSCSIGSAERPTVGQEMVAEAIGRWQPTLCQRTGAVYGYSQVADATARRQLVSDKPGVAFVSGPLTAEQADTAKGPAVYAPVTIDALAVVFNIERQTSISAPADVKARDGDRVDSLKLTPRLIAKLLTMSYRSAVVDPTTVPAANPIDLTRDPEFLELNPEFKKMFFLGIPDMLLPIGLADTTSLIWDWLKSDAEAAAFLAGKPDAHGMVVNPNFKNLETPRDDFPKRDPRCAQFEDRPPLCIFDARPYASDLHEAARSASRGDTLSRAVWDPTATPPSYKKSAPQLSGTRAILALTDAATAARYSLPTAAVRNANGEYVQPTVDGMHAAVSTITSFSTSTTPQPDPSKKVKGAYPLTSVAYAATVPLALDASGRADYVKLLDYATSDGQRPGLAVGDLPDGYAPLTPRMLQAANAAITQIEHPVAKPASTTDTPADGPAAMGGVVVGDVPSTPVGTSSSPSAGGGSSVVPVTPTEDLSQPLVPTGRRAVIASSLIPGGGAGLARYAVLGAFALGAAAIVAGPFLQLIARRRAGGL